jgi:hypothetical protein
MRWLGPSLWSRGVVVLFAGTVAIVTRGPKRRAASYKVLNTITRRDERGRLPGSKSPSSHD